MIELIVPEIMCEGCAGTIARAVGGVDPSAASEVDLGGKWVRLTTAAPAARFVAAIREAGFDAAIWWDGSPAPMALPPRV